MIVILNVTVYNKAIAHKNSKNGATSPYSD